MEILKLQSLKHELDNLNKKVSIYVVKDYIYTDVYMSWLEEYNSIVKKYNDLTSFNEAQLKCNDYELSSTGKTVRDTAVQALITTIDSLSASIIDIIEECRLADENEKTPSHQMRRCFKLGHDKCPLNPQLKKNRAFIAMPFSDEYTDAYQYGVVPALNSAGYEHYKADNEINNKDLMCKICAEIQSCGIVIVNISGLNPNVMLELGLAYGLGKSVIIIKDKHTSTVSDIGSIEYIEYSHAGDLQNKLYSAINK